MMVHPRGVFFLIAFMAGTVCACTHPMASEPARSRVAIVIGVAPPEPIKIAANELAGALQRLYSDTEFKVVGQAASATCVIHVGTPASLPRLGKFRDDPRLAHAESYVVTTEPMNGRRSGIVVGHDPAGVVYGVHGLLKQLGYGFYLSFDTVPAARSGPFSFAGWHVADYPLVANRIVFNWHNFLSGCSTWNRADWRRWIIQSQKMGYNAIMVHAYGNNPMAGFELAGVQKPVGYLSSTRVGRDWSTNHVNDVRRLWGGDIFESAVFGSVAAIKGTDRARTRVAQRLMADAFATAQQRGVRVFFAVDVDTTSANPQSLITRLPEHARFQIDVPSMSWMGQHAAKAWLVDPDTDAGYGFYKAQVADLLKVYPQIDWLVVWHRASNTPWMSIQRAQMPEAWQREYDLEIKRTPAAAQLWHAPHMFAQAKIVRAFQRAVRELNRDDVTIAFGSWRIDFLPAADRFLPAGVPLIPLDWMVLRDKSIFDAADRRAAVAQVARHRPVIPIAWAQHDDGNYVGRPYTPFSNFSDRLVEMQCVPAGFGIIHWMTKPLDLYFKSLNNQVWAAHRNEPLAATCRQMAADLVGAAAAGPMADYLRDWVTTMPKVGRETSDFFIDHKLDDLGGVIARHKSRMTLLDAAGRLPLKNGARQWLDYFVGLENYVVGIYQCEDAFNRAKDQAAAGDLAAARESMRACRPEEIIERFARFSQDGGLTRGEQGLVVSMNTRWLPHYVRFRQMLRMTPIRYNYAPTSHDPLAQSPGVFTFFFAKNHDIWQCLGTEETGAATFTVPARTRISRADDGLEVDTEICRTGIQSEHPIHLRIGPILARGSRGRLGALPLPAGAYQLSLLMLEPRAVAAGQRLFDATVSTSNDAGKRVYTVAPVQGKYLRLHCRGSDENSWNSIAEVGCTALDPDGMITASGATPGYEPRRAADGANNTRWAVAGRDHWIQFELDPDKTFDRVEVDWYEGASRKYDFDMLVSADGRKWSQLAFQTGSNSSRRLDRVDIFARAGGAHRVLRLTYPIELKQPGQIDVTLTPIKGQALICGVRLEADTAKDRRARGWGGK